MNLFHHVRAQVIEAVSGMVADGLLPAGAAQARFAVDPPRDPAHGDITTNAAMVLAGTAKRKPREIAEALALKLRAGPEVAEVAVAGPGFVNLRLRDQFWQGALAAIVREGPAYGDSFLGGGEPVNVEFVSANPTGPLHVGHGRGAVVGDALARLLAKAGWKVTREYYINDAGGQVNVLARSLHRRYREALGLAVGPPPEDFYPGEYLLPVAEAAAREFGGRFADAPEDAWREPFRAFAVEAMMAEIRGDLAALGLDFDVFTSERALVAAGKVEEAIAFLEGKGLVYTGVLEPPKGMKPEDWEPRPQTLFRATAFGDDVDRPLRKSDGSWTYFASDIAYHLDKARRGFRLMIDVWGADHGGYVKRMAAAVKALTDGQGALDVKLCQLVAVLEGVQPVRMSKRAGTFVTLRDVIERVGKDAVRFIMLTHKNDAALDFDLVKVTEQSRDNPVFYVQYAHARCRSVLRHAAGEYGAANVAPAALAAAALQRLTDGDEVALIRTLAQWPRIVETAAEAHEPHRVAFYLYDLAAQFHALWNKGKDDADLRFLVRDDRALSLARLALVHGVATVIASGLAVMGVTPLEELR